MSEAKSCKRCNVSFEITEDDLAFYEKISPTFDGQKFAIPAPTLCPQCRQQRRLAFRNERSLYRRTCDASGKQIISMYSPDKPYKVYDQKIWWSDSWDAMEYGREFDFSKTFTQQFGELMREVPRIAMVISFCENCDYAPYCTRSKGCYMSISCVESENILYSYQTNHSQKCVDSEISYYCQHCYEVVCSDHLYDCQYCVYCKDSHHLSFCRDCIGCEYCLGCVNLTHKKYCILNQQVTPEEFKIYKDSLIENEKQAELLHHYSSLLQKISKPDNHIINCVDVTGSFLINSSHCKECYNAENLEYCAYVHTLPGGAKYCYDIQYSPRAEYVYNSLSAVDSNYSQFLLHSRANSFCYYVDECYYNQHCFWCIWLRNKSYCIFNKQYTKEEYEKTVAKIIAHMQETPTKSGQACERGEFFDPSLSPFGYNETVAQEYYPCSVIARSDNDEAIHDYDRSPHFARDDGGLELSQFGFTRSTYEAPKPQSDKIVLAKDLPDTIIEVTDDILQYAIQCEVTGKLFRIQPQELAFYRKHNIPLPRKHPDQRHLERLALRK